MLDTVVVDHPKPQAVVIALHGLGADAHNLAPLAHQFQAQGLAYRFVFPNAPHRPVTINQGMKMPAWYDIQSMSDWTRFDEAALDESVAGVRQLIAEQCETGMSPQQIILLGFSQGGVVATMAALSAAQPLGALMALSSYMPAPEKLNGVRSAAQDKLPIFMAHGTWDPVLPLIIGERAAEQLQAWDYSVQWHTYSMGHDICPMEIQDIIAFWKTVTLTV